jgi:CDP-paratose 2-epimerase
MTLGTKAIITGGAGFVGCNYAWHLLDQGLDVIIYDNFARGIGCVSNVEWLRSHSNSDGLTIVKGNIRDYRNLRHASKDCDLIVHASAQVSVPLSISDPRTDFETNVVGTFNILEVARHSKVDPVVIYTSSNKVYGIPDIELVELKKRYFFKDSKGVDESFLLKGDEPYGVSKSVGDLYSRAYFLRYGLRATSFRCSCMYGPRQWGKEEQGWVAWFCIAFTIDHPITIFGNGKQVRDLLYIDDVIRAFDLAVRNIGKVAGEGINLGGGRENAVSLLEVISFLEQLTNRRVDLCFREWRPGDNKCYYTNINKARKLLRWQPSISWSEGVKRTYDWVKANESIFFNLYKR